MNFFFELLHNKCCLNLFKHLKKHYYFAKDIYLNDGYRKTYVLTLYFRTRGGRCTALVGPPARSPRQLQSMKLPICEPKPCLIWTPQTLIACLLMTVKQQDPFTRCIQRHLCHSLTWESSKTRTGSATILEWIHQDGRLHWPSIRSICQWSRHKLRLQESAEACTRTRTASWMTRTMRTC